MKKKLLLIIFIIPILIIIGGLFYFNNDIKVIAHKVNQYKEETPINIEEINIAIDPNIKFEFTNSVQVKTINQRLQGYFTYNRNQYLVSARVSDEDGNPIRVTSYLDTGVDYFMVFDISPEDGYTFMDNTTVVVDEENIPEEKINRHDNSITIVVDAPDVDLKEYGIDITPAPKFENLIEGYTSVTPGEFAITNTGTETLNDISIEIDDTTAFDLNCENLPTSLNGGESGNVTITPKTDLPPATYNATITINADRIDQPLTKQIEVKVLSRIDYVDIEMDDLSSYFVETNNESVVNNLLIDSIRLDSEDYSIKAESTKLTYLNEGRYNESKVDTLIDPLKNYFYNIVLEPKEGYAFGNDVVVTINDVELPKLTDNLEISNYEMNSNKKIQIHQKAEVPTQIDGAVALPRLKQTSFTYDGSEKYPEIIVDEDLATCTGNSGVYVNEYSITCELNDPETNSWMDTSNSSITLNWEIKPVRTTISVSPSNDIKLPIGNNIDLNTIITKNSPNPISCRASALQTGISIDGCVVSSSFDAIENRTGNFTINIDALDVNEDGIVEYEELRGYQLRITSISNVPSNLEWEENTATWDEIDGIKKYQVNLYDSSNDELVDTEEVNKNSKDFTDVIDEDNTYYFEVASYTDSGLGNFSEKSSSLDKRQEHILTNELEDKTVIYGDSFSYPISFTDNEGTITYNSSNPDVASIDNEGNITINNIGKTEISITASASENYKETTKSYFLTVKPRVLEKPIYNGDKYFSYNGKPIYLNYPTNYDSRYMTIDGTFGINPGQYQMIISLKNSNYIWSDESIDDITYNWEIYKIDNAVYKISSALNTSRVIDIKGGSKDNKANVQLYTSSNSTAQRFYIKYIKDGYYSIENLRSVKVLDVKGAKAVKGTNVWQYNYNGSNAQLWRITKNSDNTYTFTSKLGNIALDVAGAKTANGTNIQVYTPNGSKSQKFYLNKDNYLTGSQTVSNGTYVIGISKAKNQVLDIASGSTANKANVQLYKSNNSKAQRFKITHVKDGYYKIINVKSNKSLDVKSASQKNGANVWQYTYNGSAAQLWKIQKNSNGTYTFISRCNGKVIDAKGGKTANKTNIQMYSSNGSAAQKYYLTKK